MQVERFSWFTRRCSVLASFLLVVLVQHSADVKVAAIAARRQADLTSLLKKANVISKPSVVLLRAFKEEREIELWVGRSNAPLMLLKTYPICAASGVLGPKRKEGDMQVPEGLYRLTELNPRSSYHLSLKVDYPNASDALRSHRAQPGGLIYLHGHCASIGCIAIEDEAIEEVYLLAQQAQARHLHIFPFRMTSARMAKSVDNVNLAFWRELEPFYLAFESDRRVTAFRVDAKTGAYRSAAAPQ